MESPLRELFTAQKIQLNSQQLKAFQVFEEELLLWNEKFNLTAIRDREGIRVKHFLDSATCLRVLPNMRDQKVIDVGTGAGFPGIPLKILIPSIKLTLVESIGKKAAFCQHIVELLGFTDVTILTNRAEELGQMDLHRERYDIALARAVANLPILVEYLLPLIKVGGKMVAQKGDTAPVECQQADHAIKILGGKFTQLTSVLLPGVTGDRYLVEIEKIAATPNIYPRKTGIPQKKPL